MTQGRNDRFDFEAPLLGWSEMGPVHVLAIGGAGMSAVARLALARGAHVSGSDAKDSAVLEALAAAGAQVHIGHDPMHLGNAKTVVVSSAIPEGNPELRAARNHGLRVLHRSQALASLAQDGLRMAVAGANGKTTTSAMLTHALQAAGLDPSYALGGELVSTGRNADVGEGDPFVIEADESDGSFVVYHPHVAVVLNIKPDHLDFYGDVQTLTAAYGEFAETVQQGGLLVVCSDDPGARALGEAQRAAGRRVVTFGQGADADVQLRDIRAEGMSWSATVTGLAAGLVELQLPVPGEHNLMDACAALCAAVHGAGADVHRAVEGLREFPGVRRRFERRGSAAGVDVVDDYAHNPGKVAAVVRTARELVGQGRLIAVFQPHLYSRTRDFAAEFAAALAPADLAIVTGIFGAREEPMEGIGPHTVADLIQGPGEVRTVDTLGEAAAAVAEVARPGDLVLTIGAGDVTTLPPMVLDALRGRE